jgi:hypothetical protein
MQYEFIVIQQLKPVLDTPEDDPIKGSKHVAV